MPFNDGDGPTERHVSKTLQLHYRMLLLTFNPGSTQAPEAVSCVRDINKLSSVQLHAYCSGYYPDKDMRSYPDAQCRAAVKAE